MRILLFIFLFIAFIGFVDATYLTIVHYSGTTIPCFITKGCESVTTSSYSKIWSIPISLLGSLYYLSILVLSLLYIDKQKQWVPNFALPVLTFLGFLVSMILLYIQSEILKEFCSYCLVSTTTSTLLFIFAFIIKNKLKSSAPAASYQ